MFQSTARVGSERQKGNEIFSLAADGGAMSGVPAAASDFPSNPASSSRLIVWVSRRGFELLILLTLASLLIYDRGILCRDYLFKYTDEDQTCMWYAAHDLLHGRIAEPAFYGQDYNCCLEGFLAAPLVAMRVPYNVACPLVTVVLGLFPFVLLALAAWRRDQFLAAAGALAVPLILSNRYGMICGIPRGFVNGIAVAAIPIWLLLPRPAPAEPTLPINGKKLRRLTLMVESLRYFIAGALAVAAMQVNPNCVILLVPVASYALLTRFVEWKMWVFTVLGIAAALPYPLYVYRFYHVHHPDYVAYLRGVQFHWGYNHFSSYLRFAAPQSGASPVFADLVPMLITGSQSVWFLLLVFGTLAILFLIRSNIAAVCAMLAGAGILFLSFAYDRVGRGEPSNTASYPYSRMWLALPVVFVWLLLLGGRIPWRLLSERTVRWISRGTLVVILSAAIYIVSIKQKILPHLIEAEIQAPGFVICPAVPVANLYAIAREVKRVAGEQHADLLIVGGSDDRQKDVDYAIPALTGIETLFPDFERRTFRLIEESKASHDKILLIYDNYRGTRVGGGRVVSLTADGNEVSARAPRAAGEKQKTRSFLVPIITMINANGSNAYDIPELSYLMPKLITPAITPSNPNPLPRVDRQPWPFP